MHRQRRLPAVLHRPHRPATTTPPTPPTTLPKVPWRRRLRAAVRLAFIREAEECEPGCPNTDWAERGACPACIAERVREDLQTW